MSTIELKLRSLESLIRYFNLIYSLPNAGIPSLELDSDERMKQFKKIISDEVGEVDELPRYVPGQESELDRLVALADWLGDICVYCMSEMIRNGLNPEQVIRIIMQSNFTKLGADGKPIIKDGKVQKGPHFVPPEPMLRAYIQEQWDDAAAAEASGVEE